MLRLLHLLFLLGGSDPHCQGIGQKSLSDDSYPELLFRNDDRLSFFHHAKSGIHALLHGNTGQGKNDIRHRVEFRVHGTGAETADIDGRPRLPQFLGDAPGEACHVSLGRVVSRHKGACGKEPGGGSHIEDSAAAFRLHPVEDILEEDMLGDHVDIHHIDFPHQISPKEGAADSKARIVDKNIDPSPDEILAEADQVFPSGQICRQQEALRAQFGAQSLKPVTPSRDEDKRISFQRQAAGKLHTDP